VVTVQHLTAYSKDAIQVDGAVRVFGTQHLLDFADKPRNLTGVEPKSERRCAYMLVQHIARGVLTPGTVTAVACEVNVVTAQAIPGG